MGPDQCVTHAPAKKPTTLILKEKFFSWGGDFDIKDESGQVAYRVKGKVFSFRDKMVIASATDDTKLCMLQKKLLSWTPTYQIYTYSPNFAGQPSTETDGDIRESTRQPSLATPLSDTPRNNLAAAVYRFAIISSKFFSCPPQYTYSLYSASNDEPVPLWSAVEVCAWRFQMVIDNAEQVAVAKVGQTSLLQFDAANTYAVEVATGIDPLGAMCFAIAVEQIRDARKRNNNNNSN